MKRFSTRHIAFCGLIAALYVVLTWVLGEFGYGPIQFRISECMTVLPFCFPIATVGLTVGCLISNLLSTVGPLDLILGTLATLLGALGTQLCPKKNLWWLAPLPPVIANAILIGLLLTIYANTWTLGYFLTMAAQIGLSELVCCYVLGLPLLLLVRHHQNHSKRGTEL
ncbi:MAG: QueT transporter family protein [Clostridia bacterium]|nr:QueT transporter family protein [Clostridia bacterium]